MNKSIINYLKNKNDNYLTKLEKILNDIRFLNEINSEIWDSKIKYRSSWYKNLTELQPNYLTRGKWVDFIFSLYFSLSKKIIGHVPFLFFLLILTI